MKSLSKNVTLAVFLMLFCSYISHIYAFSRSISSWLFNYQQESKSHEFPLQEKNMMIIEHTYGDIYIETWNAPKIVIQIIKTVPEKNISRTHVNIKQTQGQLNIKTIHEQNITPTGWIDLYIMVPAHINIQIKSIEGTIKIKNITGVVKAELETGILEINNASNSLTLKNAQGPITARLYKIIPSSKIILEGYGPINLYLPPHINADLSAHSKEGSITSTIPLTIKPFTTTLDQQAWTKLKKEIQGYFGKPHCSYIQLCATRFIKIFEY